MDCFVAYFRGDYEMLVNTEKNGNFGLLKCEIMEIISIFCKIQNLTEEYLLF